MVVEEDSSLVVYISLKTTWGTLASPDLCGFYNEFGKNVKQASASAQTKPVLPSQKLSEGVKESSLPPPSPSPPLSWAPPTVNPQISLPSLPRGKVIWVYVNLREGPGTQYKITGKAYMKNSFEILAENPGWLRVRLEDGTKGWMSKKAASESSAAPSPQSPPDSSHDFSRTKASSKPLSPM